MRFLASLREKISRFMIGRYGMDKMGLFIWIAGLVFWCLAPFFRRHPVVYFILSAIAIVLFAYGLFRVFSRNTVRRARENYRFCAAWARIKSWFTLQRDRIRDRSHHVYRRCPSCRAVARLPKVAGKHTVRCPKCSHRYNVRIWRNAK